MKRSLRTISILLSLLTFGGVLASCGDTIKPADETGTKGVADTAVTEAEPTEADLRRAVSDDLPETDFDGYEFTFLATPGVANYYTEEENGDIMNDIRYARQRTVEERFNVKIAAVNYGGIDEDYKMFRNSVMAGDEDYDVAVLHQITAGPGLITEHIVYDWNEIPYVQMDKPWWNQTINQTISIEGKQFYIAGYITVPSPFCLFVNKSMMNDYDYEDIYQTVKDHRWTIDMLSQMCLDASKDLNGDGKYTPEADQFGISFNNDNTTLNFMYGSGIQSVIKDDSGYPTPNVNTDQMQKLFEKVHALAYEGNRAILTDYSTQLELGRGGFKDGRIMFFAGSVGDAANLRDMELDFGLIPYPMYDESQDTYHTHVDAYNGMLCVGKTVKNPERTGIITEAYAAETWKQVIPVYYDKALGDKYLRDHDSIEMMDIIFDGIVYDFGYIFDNWKGCTWTLPRMIQQNKNSNVATYWASVEKIVTKWYDKLYQSVLDET